MRYQPNNKGADVPLWVIKCSCGSGERDVLEAETWARTSIISHKLHKNRFSNRTSSRKNAGDGPLTIGTLVVGNGSPIVTHHQFWSLWQHHWSHLIHEFLTCRNSGNRQWGSHIDSNQFWSFPTAWLIHFTKRL